MSPELVLPVDDAVLEAWLQEKLAAEGKSPAVGRRFDVGEAVLDAWLAEKMAVEVPVAAEKKSPAGDFRVAFDEDDSEETLGAEVVVAAERKSLAVDRRFDADEAGSEAWLVEEGRNLPAVEVVQVPEPGHVDFLTESIVDGGGGLPPYDPYVNYLSPRPRFLFHDPKRAEQLWGKQPGSKLAAEGKPSAVERRSDADEDVLEGGVGCLPPYDPYVNFLSPRPRFRFYDPKRAERLRRELDFETFLEVDGSSSSHSDDSISEQAIDDDDDDCLQPIQEEGKGVENGAGRSSAEQFGMAEVAVAGVGEVEEKEGKIAPAVEEPKPESAHIDCPTDSIQDGELDVDGSSSSIPGDSISEQSLRDNSDDGDDEHLNQLEAKSVEKGVERSSSEQFEVKKDKKRAWCRPSLVLKSFLFLGLMILSLFGASSIYSSSNVSYDHGGVELVVKISIPLPIPSSFSFYKLMKRNFWFPSRSISVTDNGDDAYTIVGPYLGLEQMNASFNLKDIVMFTNLLEKDAFTVKSDPALLRKDTFALKSDLSFISSLDMDKRLMTTHVAVGRNAEELLAGRNIDVVEPIDIEPDKKLVSEDFPSLLEKDTLAEKSSLGSIRSLEMDEKLVTPHLTLGENVEELLSVEIFGANELIEIYPDKKQVFEVFSFHVEDPMSSKLLPSQIVSLSLEPMCNTYGIISRNALIRNHLRSLPSTRRNHSFFSHFLQVFQNYHFCI